MIDNSNPSTPVIIAFIPIPGNVDIAVVDNILYADNYIDLVALDISNPTAPKVVHREGNIFSRFTFDNQRGYLVDYLPTNQTEEIACNDPRFGNDAFWWNDRRFIRSGEFFNSMDGANVRQSSGGGAPAGVGGSFARFGVVNQYLYIVDQVSLQVLDIQKPSSPSRINTVNIGWGVETIFPYQDKLFVGANDGMYIFDNSVPTEPKQLSKFSHARACDPVVVEGETAYVTLRGGTTCEGFNNQLDIVDVKDLLNPRLLKTYPMSNPHGLSVRKNIIYLCDGESGLKSFDVADPFNMKSLDHEKIATYDAIALPNSNLLMVIGKEGLYQYDASNPKDLKQLSLIPVVKK